jgi:hypothetical protein
MTGGGAVQVHGSGQVNIGRAQTEDWVIRSQMFSEYLVCHWHLGEPIIDGYSHGAIGDAAARATALEMARRCYALPPVEHHEDSELCSKIPGELYAWRGEKSGRVVTVEHFLTTD